MSQEKPKTYTAEFRAQTAKGLGVNANTLHTRINKYSRPQSADKAIRTDEHLYEELNRLKK